MRRGLLLALLSVVPAAGAPRQEPPRAAAPPEELRLAEAVLATPTGALAPAAAMGFLALDAGRLPVRLRSRVRSRQAELKDIVRLEKGKKKGGIRLVDIASCAVEEFSAADIPALLEARFVEAREDAVAAVSRRTLCTELDMQCEFTLKIIRPSGKRAGPRRFFFQEHDPLLAFIQLEEQGARARQTPFFGAGALTCQH